MPSRLTIQIQIAQPAECTELRPPYDPEAPVLNIRNSPRFGDDCWEISAAVTTPNRATTTVNWTLIPEGAWRQTAKEVGFVQINERAANRSGRLLKPESLMRMCADFQLLVEACVALGVRSPDQLDASSGSRLIDAVLVTGNPAAYRNALNRAASLFHLRRFLTLAPPEDPFDGLSPQVLFKAPKNGENSTQRIPEAIWVPLLNWAERYVTRFAQEILAEREWRTEIENRPLHAGRQQGSVLSRLAAGVAELRQRGRALPYLCASDVEMVKTLDQQLARLSIRQIGRQCGISRLSRHNLSRSRAATEFLLATVETLGYHDDMVREKRPDALEALIPEGFAGWGLETAELDLLAACAIITAAYSGVRPSELKGLRTGCCQAREVPGRARPRFYLKGHVFKGKDDPEPAEWVTLDVVAEAISVAEQVWGEPGRLFAKRKSKRRGERGDAYSEWELERFRERANMLADSEAAIAIRKAMESGMSEYEAARTVTYMRIPTEHKGKPFRLAWKQFRRTLAFFIGMQPMGWAAGARQYKHVGIELFSGGYHGTSKSGFREEARGWGAVRRAVHYEELHRRVAAGEDAISGPASGRLHDDFERRKTSFGGDIIANPYQYHNLIKQQDVPLYPGELCDCLYDSSKALCQVRKEKATEAQQAPNWTACDPANCGNAVFYSIHRGPWEAHFKRTKVLLAQRGLTDVQRAQYEAQLREDAKVMKEITKHERKIARA